MNAASASDAICITGLGMLTSLGTAPAACAAARAGLIRLRELKVLNFAGDAIWGDEPVTGYTAPVGGDGFLGIAKALALGNHALANLLAQTGLRQHDMARTGLYLNLSDQFLVDADAVVRAEESRSRQIEPDEQAETPPLPSVAWQGQCKDFIARLLRRCDLEPTTAEARIFFGGHAGFIETVQSAIQGMRQGAFERCVVGGIDCCVEPAFLVAAVAKGLLKTAENPCGLLPGEAACFVLLEPLSRARSRGADILALVGNAATGREDFDCRSDRPPQGAALSRTIAKVLSVPSPEQRRIGLMIADLNGDAYRAMDFGCALVKLRRSFDMDQFPVWLPAQSFGETGAATGPLALAIAAQALQRHYAPPGSILVWLWSENGSRAAICLEPVQA
jgi:3-oxoacyl-[acyl-carrier-protein] synthase I